MRFIEPTLYASRRSIVELEQLTTAGMIGLVEPTTWLGSDRRFPETYLDDYERLIGAEARRAMQVGLGYGVALGVTAKEANNLSVAHRVVDALARYLSHDRVVAIGEIGLERGTPAEEEVLRRQVRLARHHGLPVMVLIPSHDRREIAGRTLGILHEEGIAPEYVLVNGVTEETLPFVRQFGAWAGLTIDRHTHVSPERAVQLLHQHGLEGITIHSAAGRQHGDPLAVPKTARRLLETGVSAEAVEKLTYHNPKWFFSQARPLPLPEFARIEPRQQPQTAHANGQMTAGGVR